jgi:hypothetical protein
MTKKIPVDPNYLYDSLDRVLRGAYDQAAKGKGKERHATDEAFEDQKICVINRWIAESPVAGALFQAIKKSVESSRLSAPRAIRELQGAINYLAAAIILLEESKPEDEWAGPNAEQIEIENLVEEIEQDEFHSTPSRICSKCKHVGVRRDEYPCKKCWSWGFKPHYATNPDIEP